MSRRSWLVYPGGWVRTSYLSGRFVREDPACEVCRRASCGPYWFHLERRVVRCYCCQSEHGLWEAVR
jgi:hypothetical protein